MDVGRLALWTAAGAATVGLGTGIGFGVGQLVFNDDHRVTASGAAGDTSPSTNVASVDWESLTYVVQEQDVDTEVTPTTDENAEMGWGIADQEFGDLDGDGNDDALVKLYNIGPSVRPIAAFVILASDQRPKGLAARRIQWPVYPSDGPSDASIEDGKVHLRAEEFALGRSNAEPANDVDATYEMRDGELVEVSRTSTPKPDSIEGRFNAMVDAYLDKDRAGVELLLGSRVDELGDVASWSTDLNDHSCRKDDDTTEVVCVLSPAGDQQVMVTFDQYEVEGLDVFVGGGL